MFILACLVAGFWYAGFFLLLFLVFLYGFNVSQHCWHVFWLSCSVFLFRWVPLVYSVYLCSSELKCLYLCLISISVFPAAVDCPGMLISTMSRVQTPVGKSVPGSLHLMVTVCSPDVY